MSLKLKRSSALALLLALAAAAPALAAVEGTRGGGQVVMDGDKPLGLRDLLDQTTCSWSTGGEVIDSKPSVKAALAKIAALDWYFALDLEREMRAIDWCFTGPLADIWADDPDALTAAVYYDTRQAAIRLFAAKEVYVDQDIFDSLPDDQVAMLILHETLHSYLAVNESMRNSKLRSAVKSLSKVVSGEIASRSALSLQLHEDGIEFPFRTDDLDRFQSYVLLSIGSADDQVKVLKSATDLGALLGQGAAFAVFADGLTASDQVTISGLTPESIVSNLCATGNPDVVDALLDNPAVGNTSLMACMGAADRAFLPKIIANPSFPLVVRDFMKALSEKTFSVENDRLVVSSAFAAMTATPDGLFETVQFTGLAPLSAATWSQYNRQGYAFFSYIRLLVENGQWQALQEQLTGNDLFYQAFNVEALATQLDAIETPVAREKALARDLLGELVQGFWSTVLDHLEAQAGAPAANKFKAMIDWKRLGVQL